ncbi:DUF4198 domain-containing protein [Acinetobacter pseudolwoffii]|uniref:DUF4198 domain-containing protein n=1 Tax=Acinetobacter pseudolwoffii TaxID=2053287 RepID=UPI001CE10035|nr:DUF4198 domain-containing protein [Acinetobacter pseudolwoffii]UBX53270.1 DUF4198 domain-containing protein [Acinetobacter pseudolwoffii]
MNKLVKVMPFLIFGVISSTAFAHYPYVAPLSYQTFNNHTAIVSGFYDNPFASEVAIKNFKFHYHTPTGQKIYLADDAWTKTQTLSSYSLENKQEGTYRIRGEKQGNSLKYAQVAQKWKMVLSAVPKANQAANQNVIYQQALKKNMPQKTVQTIDIIETFVSRRVTSNQVIQHIHAGFDVQFITHPNAFKKSQAIQLKVLDDKKGVANLNVEILAQTTDFSRDKKIYKALTTDAQGLLNFNMQEKGQYLMKIDYQQPFEIKKNDLKRYKYALAFNVMD